MIWIFDEAKCLQPGPVRPSGTCFFCFCFCFVFVFAFTLVVPLNLSTRQDLSKWNVLLLFLFLLSCSASTSVIAFAPQVLSPQVFSPQPKEELRSAVETCLKLSPKGDALLYRSARAHRGVGHIARYRRELSFLYREGIQW